jgi:ubiquitin C-terminal hydrolase
MTSNYITCLTCQNTNERVEEFFDLILPIKNFEGSKFTNIDESISFLLNPEMMDGPNQYQCDHCKTKVDALKGLKFYKLPDVLTLSLMRFDFNYQTMERMKLNDFYQFDLRLDMSKHTGNADEVYDLFAVIVHRGDAYSGHYHTIIRDSLQEAGDIAQLLAKIAPEASTLLETPLVNTERKWVADAVDVSAEDSQLMDVRILS